MNTQQFFDLLHRYLIFVLLSVVLMLAGGVAALAFIEPVMALGTSTTCGL